MYFPFFHYLLNSHQAHNLLIDHRFALNRVNPLPILQETLEILAVYGSDNHLLNVMINLLFFCLVVGVCTAAPMTTIWKTMICFTQLEKTRRTH